MDRATADYMGMLATVINALALQDSLERIGVPSRVQTAIAMNADRRALHPPPGDPAPREGPRRDLRGRHRNPYFTTDTTAALRAVEIGAAGVLKATKVDGVYTADPIKDKTATASTDLTTWTCSQRARGDGLDRADAVHGQPPADHRVRHERPGQYPPGRLGRADRDDVSRSAARLHGEEVGHAG